uniref:Ig-like domain-containing protein n=1 Tax=Oryzias sinensis TaxID=183150 RepID=A0A8C7XTH3_9TELE
MVRSHSSLSQPCLTTPESGPSSLRTGPDPLHLRYGQEQWEEGDLYDKEKQQKPQFKKKLASVRMKCFGPAHFECRLTPIGDPTMVVEWLHDGKPLAAANRLRMVNEFGYCSLDYEVAYARDSGVITCRATNKFGVDQTSLPEGRKGIVLLPEPVRVVEGDTARFRCRVTGYPAPKVNWYLNGQLIRKSKRYRLKNYSLVINKTQTEHEGEYFCSVSNPFGQSTCSSHLLVQLKEPERGREVDLTPHDKPPKFTKAIESSEVPQGGQCFFRYVVTGQPLPDIQWLKGSFHIQPNEFCVIINNPDGSAHTEPNRTGMLGPLRISRLCTWLSQWTQPTSPSLGENNPRQW